MRLFLYLLLGNLIGDFVLQPSELVRLKRSRFFGLYPHVLLVVVITALAVAGSTPLAWLAVAFVAASHLLIDRLSIMAFSSTRVPQLYILVADQVAHLAVMGGFAWAVVRYGGTPIVRPWLLPFDDWAIALACGVLAVSFAGGVFLFEAGQLVSASDPHDDEEGALLVGYSAGRVIGMVERVALYAILIVGWYWAAVPLLGARAAWLASRRPEVRARTLAESIATVAVVVVVTAATVAVRSALAS